MVTKEGETPGLGGARELGGRRKEEAEVIGVLVKNGQTTDKFTEEMVGKGEREALRTSWTRSWISGVVSSSLTPPV